MYFGYPVMKMNMKQQVIKIIIDYENFKSKVTKKMKRKTDLYF